jgi:uncharacterized protein with HEPN domain
LRASAESKKRWPEKTIRDYERSWLLRSAVERGIEVISEASRHLGRDLKAQHKDVRWKDIAGIGNILRHDYQRIDASIIWKAVKDDLPPAQGGAAGAEGVLVIAVAATTAVGAGAAAGERGVGSTAVIAGRNRLRCADYLSLSALPAIIFFENGCYEA